MEENQQEPKFEVPEQPEGTHKKGSKKGLLICLVVVLILALIGGGVYYFFFNKGTKLQATDTDKVTNSADKVEAKINDIIDGFSITERKINENLKTKPFTDKYTITGQINQVSMNGVNSSDVEMVKQAINGQSIVIEGQGNLAEGKLFAELQAMGQKLGNAVITKDVMAVQVPMVESKYYALFKDSLQNSKYSTFSEVFNILDYITGDSFDMSKYELSDDEMKHFEKTYGDIIKNHISKDKISSESTEVTVDGETKKCDKVTYSIDNDTFKSILKDYVETFKNDKDGQNIIIDKALDVLYSVDLVEKYMSVSQSEMKSTITSSIEEMAEELIEELDYMKIDEAKIVVYATATETYKVELSLTIDEQTLKITINLNKNSIDIKVDFQEEEMLTASLENNDGEMKLTAKIIDGSETVVLEATAKSDKDGSKYSAKLEADGGVMEITANTTVKEDTATKLDEDIAVNFKFKYEDVNIDVTLNVNRLAEIVDSITVPEVTKANSIDLIAEGYIDSLISGNTNTTPAITTPSIDYNTNTNQTTTNNNTLENVEDIQSQIQEIQTQTQNLQSEIQATQNTVMNNINTNSNLDLNSLGF